MDFNRRWPNNDLIVAASDCGCDEDDDDDDDEDDDAVGGEEEDDMKVNIDERMPPDEDDGDGAEAGPVSAADDDEADDAADAADDADDAEDDDDDADAADDSDGVAEADSEPYTAIEVPAFGATADEVYDGDGTGGARLGGSVAHLCAMSRWWESSLRGKRVPWVVVVVVVVVMGVRVREGKPNKIVQEVWANKNRRIEPIEYGCADMNIRHKEAHT
jgi:hypothetical protein